MNLGRLLSSGMAMALFLWGTSAGANGQLKTIGKGKAMVLDFKQFKGEYAANYKVFKVRCTKCHEMRRPIIALQTGVTPMTGSNFDRAGIKVYVIKMMRKAHSNIDKRDAKNIIRFLVHARNLAQGK